MSVDWTQFFGSYIKVFPVDETIYYMPKANFRQGPFFGPRSIGMPSWDNHEAIVTCDGFTFPTPHPDTNASYPMLVPRVTGQKSVLENNHSLLTRWENNVADFHFTAVSPDKKKAAVINGIAKLNSTTYKQWSIAVFTVQGGDREAALDHETTLVEWPLEKNIVPRAIALDNSGNIYLAGWGHPFQGLTSAGLYRLTFAKFNSSGELQWVHSLYAEGDEPFPQSNFGAYQQWGSSDDPYTERGPEYTGSTVQVSHAESEIVIEMQCSRTSDFASILCTKSTTRDADSEPFAFTLQPTYAELGFDEVTNPLPTTKADAVPVYSRIRFVVNGVEGPWSDFTNILYLSWGYNGDYDWYSDEVQASEYPHRTVFRPRSTHCEMQLVGTVLHLCIGGAHFTYGTDETDYTMEGTVQHYSVSTDGATIVVETADTPNYWEGAYWRAWSSSPSNASLELIADGDDLYCCPTMWNGWNWAYPAFVLCRHDGTWSRLHLHLPAGVNRWESAATTHHLFLLDGKPVFLGQGYINVADTTATCWLYAELDPTVQDQTVNVMNMPTFTYTYNGTTYTYGYWGSQPFTVGFDGRGFYVSGQEAFSDPTQRVYYFSLPALPVEPRSSFPWVGKFQLCHTA